MKLLLTLIGWEEYPPEGTVSGPLLCDLSDPDQQIWLKITFGNGIIGEMRVIGDSDRALQVLKIMIIRVGVGEQVALSLNEKSALWLYQEGDDSYIQEGEPPGYIFVDPLPQPALFLPGEITKARPIKVALQPSIPKKDQKKKWKMADPRLEKRAKRLVEKYASSCPPRAGPPVSAQDGLMEVWEWAEKKDRTDILSSLSQVAGVLFRATGQESLFRSKLSNLIERAKVEQRLDEYDDLLLGLANVEKKVEVRLAAYEEALRVYSLLGDTGGEAVSAALVAEIYQQQNKIQEALCLYLHSFSLWSKLEHKMGIGISLMHLSRILELEGRFVDASQMMYVARKTIPASLWKISARDSLNRIVFEYELASEQCETKMTPEELVRTIFSSV